MQSLNEQPTQSPPARLPKSESGNNTPPITPPTTPTHGQDSKAAHSRGAEGGGSGTGREGRTDFVNKYQAGATDDDTIVTWDDVKLPADPYDPSGSWDQPTGAVAGAPSSLADVSLAPRRRYEPSPQDWRDEVVYAIMVDRFARAEGAGFSHGDPKSGHTWHGGNIRGIIDRLDYLQGAGTTALMLTSVLQSARGGYHGYWPIHLMGIDPHYGTMADFQELVSKAHERGMRVIFDLVVNHAGKVFEYSDGCTKWHKGEAGSTPRDVKWLHSMRPIELASVAHFYRRGDIVDWDDPDQSLRGDFPLDLRAFNVESAKTRELLIQVAKWWVKETDVDGFRLDAYRHVHHEFWDAFHREVRDYASLLGKNNFLLLGEISSGNESDVSPHVGAADGKLDCAFDYPGYRLVNAALHGRAPARDFAISFERAVAAYGAEGAGQLMRFIDNHDTYRFMREKTPGALLGVGLAYLLLSSGIPMVYYGTEQGFRQAVETMGPETDQIDAVPRNREDMFSGGKFVSPASSGDRFDQQSRGYCTLQRLTQLRKLCPALRRGEQYTRWSDPHGPGIYAFSRIHEGEEVVVVLNTACSRRTSTMPVDMKLHTSGAHFIDALASEYSTDAFRCNRGATKITVEVPPHGVRVLCRTAADLVRHSHALTTSRILADVPAPKRPLETSSTTVDLTMRSMWVRSSRICELYPRIHKRRLANGRCEGKGRFLREFGVADFDDIRRSDIRTDTLQLRGVWSSKQLGFVPEVPEGMAGSCISHVMVASELGTNEDLKRFIHLAHEMGHKVVLDLIPIHASIDSALLAKHPEYFVSMEADVENPDTIPDDHFPYYDAKGRLFWVARAGDGVEEGTRSRKSVQLDLSKQIVRDLLVATAVRLVTEFDVDGLHVDATYVPLNKVFEQRWGLAMPETEILAEVAAAVKSMKASTALIVEAHDDTREVSRIGVDLVYNKSWYNAMRSRGPDRIRRALEKTAYLNWQQGCAGGLQFISHRSEVSPPKAFGAFVQGACILTAFLPTAQLSYYAGTSQNGKDHAHNHIYRDAAAFYSRNASVRMEVLGGEGDPWVSYILRGSNEDLLIAANPTGWPIDVSAQESLCLHLQPGEGQTVRISSWKLESSRVVVGLQQLMCAPRVTDELTGIDNINIDRPVNHTMRKNRPTRVNTGVPLSILMVAPEAAPFIKTGGLADVVSELTRKMADQGHIVKLVLPYYTGLKAPQALEAAGEFEAVTGAGRRTHKLYRSKIGGAELLLIEDHELFNIQTPYDKAPAPNYDTGTIGTADPMEEMGEDQRKAYELGEIRFIHFSYAALAAAKSLNFCPDVVHVHDWATALIPILLKASSDLFFAQTASVLTIHNMAWQGWITPKTLRITGLWDMEQARAALEFTSTFGNHGFSLLKGGIATADKVNAVSQTYAKEICSSQEFGMGLETILEGRGEDLTGVVNGLDMDLWDPATDPEVQFHYSTLTEADYQKRKNKMALQREGKLNVDPEVLLFGVTARLDRQKGLDLVTAVIPEIVRRGGQFALAGNGSPELHAAFERLRESFPANVYAPLVFDEKLARRIHSASDFYLGPSRFEPCGLSQQQAMRYGSVPICSATGGHLDTVEDYWADPTLGTGLFLTQLSEQGMLDAVEKAFILYGQRAHYLRARSHGMERDVSWDLAAHDYAEIYREAMKKQTHAMLPAVAACVSK